MRWILAALLNFCVIMSSAPAAAQSIYPPTTVFGEGDNEDLRACNVSHRSAIAQAEAALRQNNIRLGLAAPGDHESFLIYVNLNGGEVRRGWCVLNVAVTYYVLQYVQIETTGETVFTRVVFCDKATTFSVASFNAQSSINSRVQDDVNQCLSEYSRLPRR